MSKNISHACENRFLSELMGNQCTVSVYLRHGIKLTGKLVGMSETAIFLDEPTTQMIYKDSISTVVPVSDKPETFV